MSLVRLTATSHAEEIQLADKVIVGELATGKPVDLVAPNENWAGQRKALLRDRVPMGVNVQTYEHWLAGLWDLVGDGTELVNDMQRRIILRPLFEQMGLLGSEPSVRLVRALACFVTEATAPGLAPKARLEDSESKLMGAVSLYERELELHGLVESVQVEQRLLEIDVPDHALVLEEPRRTSSHVRHFLAAFGEKRDVTIVQRELPARSGKAPALGGDELASLRSRLYSGIGGLEPTGRVMVGEAHGYHARGALLAEMISRLMARGMRPDDICVVFPQALDAYPDVLDALSKRGVPFATEISLPAGRTGLGNAFAELQHFDQERDSDSSYEPLSDFIASPYSGLVGEDARAVQTWWRSQGGATPQSRYADLTKGFNAGRASSKEVRERLAPMAELLAAAPRERVCLLFDHAREAHLDADQLVDDRAAAEALLDYLDECARFEAEIDVDELSNVPVTLARSFGADDGHVSLVDAGTLALDHAPCVIMADLDADHYPMASEAGVFDVLLEKLGAGSPDETAREKRLTLLDLVESADEVFVACRPCNTKTGDENGASALWDELMAVYRSEGDRSGDMPAALLPFLVKVNEMELFEGGPCRESGEVEVFRGHLYRDEAVYLLSHDSRGRVRELSPTQLEDYYRCPYRWFASRRIGYNSVDRAFDQSSQGTLFHDAMARFYPALKAEGHERVTPENLDMAVELAKRAFDEQVKISQQHPQKAVFLRTQLDLLSLEDLREKMVEFVKRDASFLPGYVPTYFEVGLGRGTTEPLEYATAPVRGAVDRIDMDDAGHAVIIDYKLSSLSVGYGLASDPEANDGLNLHIQTDIYARLVERHFASLGKSVEVVGSVYRSYSKNTLRGVYKRGLDWGGVEDVVEKNDALPREGQTETYAQYLERVEETMTSCMGRLIAGDIEPRPLVKGVCLYCKALPFCPRAEV